MKRNPAEWRKYKNAKKKAIKKWRINALKTIRKYKDENQYFSRLRFFDEKLRQQQQKIRNRFKHLFKA